MLFGIIGTIDRGNFVFDRWPRNKQIPTIKGPISAGELSQKLSEYFYYMGIFRKNQVLQTSQAKFSQSCIIQIFNANQKRLEVVLGIDDQCVMVSRSTFIINNERSFVQNPATVINTNLFVFQDLEEDKKDIVNSVTLVWKAENFDQVSNIKNKLSFMVGVLRHMEQSEDYLSRQIIKITEVKNNFDKKIKQKCQELMKDPTLQFQQFKTKQMFQQFYDLAQESTKCIQLFTQISKFYDCCALMTEYNVSGQSWAGSVGSYFNIPLIKTQQHPIYKKKMRQQEDRTVQISSAQIEQLQIQQMMSKTTLATQKKLQYLPKALKDERITRLYNNILNINDASLQQLIHKQTSISINSALQTINFLKHNEIGLNVYPFDLKKYYSLYALKKLPSWALIKKFDEKIFPSQSMLKQTYSFSKFKRINYLQQKLKYIILQGIIHQVDVYIYYLETLKQIQKVRHIKLDYDFLQEQESENADSLPRKQFKFNTINGQIFGKQKNKLNQLHKFANKPISLNQILRQDPSLGKISDILKIVIQSMKKQKIEDFTNLEYDIQKDFLQKPKWGFYYVQKI